MILYNGKERSMKSENDQKLSDLSPKEQENLILTRKEHYNNVICVGYGKNSGGRSQFVSSFPKDWHSNDKVFKKMFPKDLGPKGDSFVFFLNRKLLDPNSLICSFQASAYQVNEDTEEWNQIVGEFDQTRLSIELIPYEKKNRVKAGHAMAQIIIKETWSNLKVLTFEVDGNNGIMVLSEDYHESKEHFVSLYDTKSRNYGFVLNPDDSSEFRYRVQLLNEEQEYYEKEPYEDDTTDNPFYACIGLIRQNNFTDSSLVVVTKKNLYSALYPIMKYSMDLITRQNEKNLDEVLRELYMNLNKQVEIPRYYLSMKNYQKKVLRWSIVDHEKTTYQKKFKFMKKDFHFKTMLGLFDSEVGDEKCSIAKLLTKFKVNLMVIFNAMFQEKRILFFSKNQSIAEISRVLFSSCLLVSPPLSGLIDYRVFPYCTKEDVETFTRVSGYIVGVNDPSFEHETDLWDIFCNIDTGVVKKNPKTYTTGRTSYGDFDMNFAKILLEMMYSHVLSRLKIEYTDFCLRSHFQSYTQDLINMAIGRQRKSKNLALNDSLLFLNNAREKNFSRIQNWKKTYSYSFFLKKYGAERKESSITGTEQYTKMRNCVTLLKTGNLNLRLINEFILDTLSNVLKRREQLLEFLSYFPLVQGGLYPIAVLVFHKNENVRKQVSLFLKRMEKLKEGYCCVAQLNMFIQIQYDRTIRSIESSNRKSIK